MSQRNDGAGAAGPVTYETMRLDDLAGDPGNPRRMPEAAADGLAESIATFGCVMPPVFNRRTGQLVGGHQRVAELRRQGVVETVVAVGDWSPEEQRALNVALNNPKIQGKFTGDLEQYLRDAERLFEPARFRRMRFGELFKRQRDRAPAPAVERPANAADVLRAPFPYFGGKRTVADMIWQRFGRVKQYVEPFCGSAAVLLASPYPAPLEVIGDASRYVANFWRAVKYQPEAVAGEADYPVSHIDLTARHGYLVNPERCADLDARLADPEWPGDARVAGWWVWGQCAWIGDGWCRGGEGNTIAFVGNAGRGLNAHGKIAHAGDAGRRLNARGQIAHVSSAGQGINSTGLVGEDPGDGRAPSRRAIDEWLGKLSRRLRRVVAQHGSWDRCLNLHYGTAGDGVAAVFLDPPYLAFEKLYAHAEPVARDVEAWARERASGSVRIALCGHAGDYDLPGWDCVRWSRGRLTYGSDKTTDEEAIWFSPSCLRPVD